MMDTNKEKIVYLLSGLKGAGSFVTNGSQPLKSPGIEIKGFGELAFPVNAVQAKALMEIAQKAPFGKGHDTVYDDQVRRTWEIDASQINFLGKSWKGQLAKILEEVQEQLGIIGYKVDASLYKLLIYNKGDFFLPHRDSEKEKGMFGSLIINLPSRFTGGELVVSFGAESKVVDFAASDDLDNFQYAAFYADCEHEVKPITSGFRVCLAYNLIQKAGAKIAPRKTDQISLKLMKLLEAVHKKDSLKPQIILLGHQYTPENFSYDNLKLNDRPKADVILKAASQAGYYAKLCLVTSYIMGAPEGGGYYEFYDEGDEDAAMEEVYDESLYVEHWAAGDCPSLYQLEIDQEELITSFPINDGDPIVKEFSGYMGNYGPDLEHWYHYGAIVLWSHQTNAEKLTAQDSNTLLAWMDYFLQNPDMATSEEKAAIDTQLMEGFKQTGRKSEVDNYNKLIKWVISQKNKNFFDALQPELWATYFLKIDAKPLIELFQFLGGRKSQKLLLSIGEHSGKKLLEKWIELLIELDITKVLPELVAQQLDRLPENLIKTIENTKNGKTPLNEQTLQMIMWLAGHFKLSKSWQDKTLEELEDFTLAPYRNSVVFPSLISAQSQDGFCKKLAKRLITYLKALKEPKAPENWIRQLPEEVLPSKVHKLLAGFFSDPDQQVFDYKALQANRREVEHTLERADLDIKWETIRRGSPQTLRITKTSKSFKRLHKQWELDQKQLEELQNRFG